MANTSTSQQSFTVRTAEPGDMEAMANAIYKGFKKFSDSVGLVPEFDSATEALALVKDFVEAERDAYAVVAVDTAKNIVVGCNFTELGDDVACIGPIAVDPDFQGKGVGKALMRAVMDEAHKTKSSIRLTQVASNITSFSLYLSLGFRVVEPLVAFSGKFRGKMEFPSDVLISEMEVKDIPECDKLHKEIVGVSRKCYFETGLSQGYPECPDTKIILARDASDKKIIGVLSGLFIDGILFAKNQNIAKHLMAWWSLNYDKNRESALKFHVISTRYLEIVKWAISNGFRVHEQSTIMVLGDYTPISSEGVYCPSVSY